MIKLLILIFAFIMLFILFIFIIFIIAAECYLDKITRLNRKEKIHRFIKP